MIDSKNMHLCIVPAQKQEQFDDFVAPEGEMFFMQRDRELSVHDGATKGGVQFYNKDKIAYLIRYTEINGELPESELK